MKQMATVVLVLCLVSPAGACPDLLLNGGTMDFDYQSVDAAISYQLDERNQVSAGIFGSFFEAPDRFNNETDTYGFQATYSRIFSERLQADLILGVRRSKQEFRDADQGFDENTTGGVGSLSVTRKWEKSALVTRLAALPATAPSRPRSPNSRSSFTAASRNLRLF